MFIKMHSEERKSPFYIAFSGGKDSLAAAHFITTRPFSFPNYRGLVHFNHNLPGDDLIEEKVKYAASKLRTSIYVYRTKETPNKKDSVEDWCRKQRYKCFDNMFDVCSLNIVVCHHLGDATEQYFMNFLKGCPEHKPIRERLIRESGCKIIRPMITTRPKDINKYIIDNNLQDLIVEDPMNKDLTKKRNMVRDLLSTKFKNDGLEKVVLKKFYL